MGIGFEKEVCEWLRIPSIPKREWDGKSSFNDGVAVLKMQGDGRAFAVCSFDAEHDKAVNVRKVFSTDRFVSVEKVFVVPSYMDVNLEGADLDAESMKKAEALAQEAAELEATDDGKLELPKNEYLFDHIHSDEEAIAFISAWNRKNGRRKAGVPKKHDAIIARLGVIWYEQERKQKGK